ncbi:hypothetical protein T440DRAFT_244836 [Plenodomus tracheiphilus IPT5]|uniref:Uncharacterized protein n=1 Tax=Plenodomus tracheiphilus IPT5 TaxID=1408161 RepID=A0A6A7BKA8_9PLEO|nr:hypothetical protein T440DRAFT_244836 [Plenodomus tracheiphilus IPT5]
MGAPASRVREGARGLKRRAPHADTTSPLQCPPRPGARKGNWQESRRPHCSGTPSPADEKRSGQAGQPRALAF